MKHSATGLVLVMSAWFLAPTCHAQDSMERGLLKQAPKLIKFFKDQGYKNVGVLKFLVNREGKDSFSDNVGTMNLLAARRLELALILANDPNNPVGIVENASDVASKIVGASHLSKEARKKLFAKQYPLAWGKETVLPDGFVTGLTSISKDLKSLTITLHFFDRATNKLVELEKEFPKDFSTFTVANATNRLSEMGESFVLRGESDGGKSDVTEEKVFKEAAKVRDELSKHPARIADQPVTLEVFYDGKKMPLEFREGKAFLTEPREGQSVHFGLRRDNSKERYGVVLKVNGENTLDKERMPDLSCRKWILDPGEGPWTIAGYQIGNDVREKFRVASMAESKEREVNYGYDVGTITMTVFREQKGKPQAINILDDEVQYQSVIAKLAQLPKRPDNYSALKNQLLKDANRGLIVEGQREDSKVQVVSFLPDPNPIMCVTIVYYRK